MRNNSIFNQAIKDYIKLTEELKKMNPRLMNQHLREHSHVTFTK